MPSFHHIKPERISLNGKRHAKVQRSTDGDLRMAMLKRYNLTGKRFDKLLVLSRDENINQESYWLCLCDCGRNIIARGKNLRNGWAYSCGCYQKPRPRKHGRKAIDLPKHDRTYTTYVAMKGRVLNPNDPAYPRYGGRGIKICQQWLDNGFINFLEDMGERPEGKSLDRIDNNGDYCPENCRWATKSEQCRNRRSSRFASSQGKTMTISAWAEELNIGYYKLIYRLNKGLSIEEIVKLQGEGKV